MSAGCGRGCAVAHRHGPCGRLVPSATNLVYRCGNVSDYACYHCETIFIFVVDFLLLE